jgi:hypothetical protein
MAKPKTETTPAQKAVLDARQKLEVAKGQDAKSPNDNTKKAVVAAEQVLKTAQAVENRERFVRVGGTRVKKARAAILNFGKVNQPRSYTYSEDDIAKAETVLGDALNKAISGMRQSLTKGPTAQKEADNFTF